MSGVDILLVEDDSITRLVMRLALQQEGYRVTEASDGIVALRIFATRSFDMVITDLTMPNLGGLELVSRLRSAPGGTRLRIMVVTGRASVAESARREQLRVDAVLVKPLFPSDLVREVRKRLAGGGPELGAATD